MPPSFCENSFSVEIKTLESYPIKSNKERIKSENKVLTLVLKNPYIIIKTSTRVENALLEIFLNISNNRISLQPKPPNQKDHSINDENVGVFVVEFKGLLKEFIIEREYYLSKNVN